MTRKQKIILAGIVLVVTAASIWIVSLFYLHLARNQRIVRMTETARQAAAQIEFEVMPTAESENFRKISGDRFIILCLLNNNRFKPVDNGAFPADYAQYMPIEDDPAIAFHSENDCPRYSNPQIAAEGLLAICVPVRFHQQPAYCFVGMPQPKLEAADGFRLALTLLPLAALALLLIVRMPQPPTPLGPPPVLPPSKTAVTELQIIHLGRLSALRQVTTGIIHELNQPLCVIKGYLELLLMMQEQPEDANPEEIKKYLGISLQNLDRTSNILQHIRTFVRDYREEEESVDMVTSLHHVLDFFGEQFHKRSIQMELKIPDRIVPVRASAALVEQAIVNLMANARDSFQTVAAKNKKVVIRLEESKGYVTFAIDDNGCGMDGQAVKHCTAPFYTSVPENCGLGLAAVRLIAAKFNGFFKINSIKDRGTSAALSLPIWKG